MGWVYSWVVVHVIVRAEVPQLQSPRVGDAANADALRNSKMADRALIGMFVREDLVLEPSVALEELCAAVRFSEQPGCLRQRFLQLPLVRRCCRCPEVTLEGIRIGHERQWDQRLAQQLRFDLVLGQVAPNRKDRLIVHDVHESFGEVSHLCG